MIKPCPFCGEQPSLVQTEDELYNYVFCDNTACEVAPCSDMFDSEYLATKAWNKRKDDEKTSA